MQRFANSAIHATRQRLPLFLLFSLTRKITGRVKLKPSSATSGGGCGTGSARFSIASAASSKAASPDPFDDAWLESTRPDAVERER